MLFRLLISAMTSIWLMRQHFQSQMQITWPKAGRRTAKLLSESFATGTTVPRFCIPDPEGMLLPVEGVVVGRGGGLIIVFFLLGLTQT